MSAKLAGAALAMGLLSFVHLFGVEKAGMAVVFATMALKDPAITPGGRTLALTAIAAGLAYLLILSGVFVCHMPLISELASGLAK